MKIDLSNGNLIIGELNFRKFQKLEDVRDLVSGHGCVWELVVDNQYYKSYNIKPINDSVYRVGISVIFKNGLIESISFSIDVGMKTWDDFTEEILEKAKKETKKLINDMIGSERFDGAWGTIAYFFDPKGMSVGIVVNYK